MIDIETSTSSKSLIESDFSKNSSHSINSMSTLPVPGNGLCQWCRTLLRATTRKRNGPGPTQTGEIPAAHCFPAAKAQGRPVIHKKRIILDWYPMVQKNPPVLDRTYRCPTGHCINRTITICDRKVFRVREIASSCSHFRNKPSEMLNQRHKIQTLVHCLQHLLGFKSGCEGNFLLMTRREFGDNEDDRGTHEARRPEDDQSPSRPLAGPIKISPVLRSQSMVDGEHFVCVCYMVSPCTG